MTIWRASKGISTQYFHDVASRFNVWKKGETGSWGKSQKVRELKPETSRESQSRRHFRSLEPSSWHGGCAKSHGLPVLRIGNTVPIAFYRVVLHLIKRLGTTETTHPSTEEIIVLAGLRNSHPAIR